MYESSFNTGYGYAGRSAEQWHAEYRAAKRDYQWEKLHHEFTKSSLDKTRNEVQAQKERASKYKTLYHSTPEGKKVAAVQKRKATVAQKQAVKAQRVRKAQKTRKKNVRKQKVQGVMYFWRKTPSGKKVRVRNGKRKR